MEGNYKVLGRQVPVAVIREYFDRKLAPVVTTDGMFDDWSRRISREESRRILDYYGRRSAAETIRELPDDALDMTTEQIGMLADAVMCLMAPAS